MTKPIPFELHVPDTDIADAGWGRMNNLTQLKELRLALTKVQKPETLAPFVNLRALDLTWSYVADAAMPALEGMKDLRRLSLAGTLVTETGLQAHSKSHPCRGSGSDRSEDDGPRPGISARHDRAAQAQLAEC